jgi:hypothetical protein
MKYRLYPNPDIEEGYNGGAYLAVSDPDGENLVEVFVSPDALMYISEMFRLAAEEHKGE